MNPVRNQLQKEAPHYFDELYNFSLAMTGSFRKSEKMLMRILKEASQFYSHHEPSDIRQWLLRIALNIYTRFYQVNNISDNEKIDNDYENLPHQADRLLVEEYFKGRDTLKLLSAIPSDLRLVLILKEILNLNYGGIAELVDIPEGTVIMRLNRARRFIYLLAAGKA
jgi:RNA polymerase sigma-70 factor, ECF subfamily